MDLFPTVRVAAIQAAPVAFDLVTSMAVAIRLMREAKANGAELVVFPECFLSVYPSSPMAAAVAHSGRERAEFWMKFWESSVECPGPIVDELIDECLELNFHCVIGINERESGRPGASVYNTMLTIGPNGLLHRHRKLMPTHHERMFHAFGDGKDLAVVATPLGRIGGLICWENRMPLARYAVYRGVPQIWVAPTADFSESWVALLQAIAVESGAFVVGVCQYTNELAGGTVVIDARGRIMQGPLRNAEGILYADCDLQVGAAEKQLFDVTGHYSCESVLLPVLGFDFGSLSN